MPWGKDLCNVFKLPTWAKLILVLCSFPPAYAQVAPGLSTIDITVRVVEAGTSAPVGLVKVELFQVRGSIVGTMVTDERGRAEFYQIPREPYGVRAFKDGYQTAEVRIDIDRNDLVREVVVELRQSSGRTKLETGDVVEARTLAIPKAASKEFRKGVEFLNKKHDPQRAIEHFRKAISVFPDYYEAYFLLGMAYVGLQALQEAKSALQKSVELKPDFVSPYHPLAVILIAEKHYDEAEALLLKAMQLDPEGWQWPFELARCYATRGQWEKAIPYGQTAHERPHAPSKVHLLMVDLYRNTNDPGRALEELEEFARVDPTSSYMPRVKEAMSELRGQIRGAEPRPSAARE